MSITTQAALAKYLASGKSVKGDYYRGRSTKPRSSRLNRIRSSRSKRRTTSRSRRSSRSTTLITAPTAQALRTRPSRISFGPKGGSSGIIVQNKEYIGDVTTLQNSSALRTILTTLITPANSGLFPWLAGIAQKFDTYKFHQLTFHYEPACTSSATGQVMIAPDFDPNDQPPSNWAAAAAYIGATHGSVWAPLNCNCNTSYLTKRGVYYNEMPSIPSPVNPSDIRELAVGRINILIDGVTNNGTVFGSAVTLGKLYVSYKVSLYEPDYTNTLIAGASGVGAKFKCTAAECTNLGVAGTAQIGANIKLNPINTGQIPFTLSDAGVFTCTAPCELMVSQKVIAAAAPNACNAPTIVTPSGASVVTTLASAANGVNTSVRIDIIRIIQGDSFTILAPASAGAITDYEIRFSPYPYVFA